MDLEKEKIMPFRTYKPLLILLACLAATAAAVDTRDGRNPNKGSGTAEDPYLVPRISTDIRIDGNLDEEAWKEALLLELSYEVQPGENTAAPVRTEVYLVYDNSCLYAAFKAFDPDPSAIRAHLSDRDNAWSDDVVALVLDTFNDERRDFLLGVNPLGVQIDTVEVWIGSGGGGSWDTIWDSAARITDWGWSAEMKIPFSSIRFQRGREGQVWGFDAIRLYPRSQSHLIGTFPRDRNNNCYLCQAIKIKGFDDATPGRNVEISPTFTAVRTDNRPDFPAGELQKYDQKADIGLTARWGITPNITLGGTVNPDFSQVEADSLQLDINQPFALFYSEKRPFFVEGSDFFSTPLDAVYTRTMRDPSWGIKLSGKEGANTLGAYVVRDDLTNIIFPGPQGSHSTSLMAANTSSVFRYKRDIGSKYTLGLLLTDREGDDYFNRVLGFDGEFRFTDKDQLSLQVLGSSTRYPGDVASAFDQQSEDFGDSALELYYLHSARTLTWWGGFRQIGTDFRSDLGFIPQVGFRRYLAGSRYAWIPKEKSWFSTIFIQGSVRNMEDLDGNLLERLAYVRLNYEGLPKSSHSYVEFDRSRESYNGLQFDLNSVVFHHCMSPNAHSHTGVSAIIGDRIDYANTRLGKRLYLTGDINYSLTTQLRVIFSQTYERLTVDQGRLYTAKNSEVGIVYHFNTRTFFRSIFQFVDYSRNTPLYTYAVDSKFKRFFTQLLFSYKINPQTVLFIGYSDNYLGSQEYGLTQSDRTFFVKLGYAWVL
jgi:hypothetical protein